MNKNIVIYEGVKIGKDPIIEDYVILGKPTKNAHEYTLLIGNKPTIRSFSVLYIGSKIGDHFQTGDYTRIRENNVIGNFVSIGAGSIIECDCTIQDYVRIHSNCFIPEFTNIKNNAWIGPGVIMTNVLHPPCPIFKKFAPLDEKCCIGPVIEQGAIVGAGSILLPGITIGENAVIGAGSVVIKHVPSDTVVAGNPAKIIKKVSELVCPLNYYIKGEIYSWRKK